MDSRQTVKEFVNIAWKIRSSGNLEIQAVYLVNPENSEFVKVYGIYDYPTIIVSKTKEDGNYVAIISGSTV